MIALLGALLSTGAVAADADAVFSLNTGMRPLGLPVLSSVFGGGFRAGLVLGPITPFAGGAITTGRGASREGDPAPVYVHAGTAQLGARVRVLELAHAETFLIAGALLSSGGGRSVWDTDGNRGSGVRVSVGPGGFLGGGADAFLNRRVSLGIEAGLAYIGGSVKVGNTEGTRLEADSQGDGGLLFTYTTLGLTVWVGGEK